MYTILLLLINTATFVYGIPPTISSLDEVSAEAGCGPGAGTDTKSCIDMQCNQLNLSRGKRAVNKNIDPVHNLVGIVLRIVKKVAAKLLKGKTKLKKDELKTATFGKRKRSASASKKIDPGHHQVGLALKTLKKGAAKL